MSTKRNDRYHIYGRKEYPSPLTFVREAEADEIPRVAQEEEGWVEMIAFPAAAAIQVIPWEDDDE